MAVRKLCLLVCLRGYCIFCKYPIICHAWSCFFDFVFNLLLFDLDQRITLAFLCFPRLYLEANVSINNLLPRPLAPSFSFSTKNAQTKCSPGWASCAPWGRTAPPRCGRESSGRASQVCFKEMVRMIVATNHYQHLLKRFW